MSERVSVPRGVAIVLAAGESRRMGVPKLLLPIDGDTLLSRAVARAAAVTDAVVVVVGAYADAYGREARRAGAAVVVNPAWARGLGTSLRAGIAALPPRTPRALLMLADQPFVPEAHLAELLRRAEAEAPLALSRYGDGNDGVPVAIDASLFGSASQLPDDCGARALARRAPTTARVFLPRAAQRDIDTPGDAERWLGASVEADPSA